MLRTNLINAFYRRLNIILYSVYLDFLLFSSDTSLRELYFSRELRFDHESDYCNASVQNVEQLLFVVAECQVHKSTVGGSSI